MPDFCELCGSLIIQGNCTNRKCKNHKKVWNVLYEQINYIKWLLEVLDADKEYDYRGMTKTEASKIIQELLEQVEMGEE
jgi:hypothetical protein